MMSRVFFLCYLTLALLGFERAFTANESGFNAEVSLSANSISLNDTLTLNAILSFPSSYHPNVDAITSELLSYNGFYPPAFHLMEKETKEIQKIGNIQRQEIKFILSPQIPGIHKVTLQLIKFDSEDEKEKSVYLPTEIFDLQVSNPKVSFDAQDLISPPMTFSKLLPVTIDLANKRGFQDSALITSTERTNIESSLLTKNPPWIMLISAIVVLIAIAIIRS